MKRVAVFIDGNSFYFGLRKLYGLCEYQGKYGVVVDILPGDWPQATRKYINANTLKDFVNSQGEPGHFMVQTKVYDRTGEPCYGCEGLIKQIKQGQRSTFYCPNCQK